VLEAALERLAAAVGALRMPPWPPAAAAASPAAAALLARRFGKALRLLRALGCFEGVLARAPLAGLALERLLHQQARRPDERGRLRSRARRCPRRAWPRAPAACHHVCLSGMRMRWPAPAALE